MSLGVGEVYFEVNGDVELKGENDTNSSFRCITWRGDPEDTGSDCSITIVTNELQTNTYYVHKSVICFGSKQSKYFASQFIRNSAAATSMLDNSARKNPAIKVELDQRDAENFPLFLDFVYKTSENQEFSTKEQCQSSSLGKIEAPIVANGTMETVKSSFSSPSLISNIPSSSSENDEAESAYTIKDDITTENAVSLRYLARRFENEALTIVVNKFIQKDLNFNTGPIYLYNAWEYKDERLVESAQRLCAENISQIDMKALLRLPLNLFRVVVKSLETFEYENQELSIMLSDVVCRYLEQNPKSSTAELLLDLTDPLLMPYISPDAAIGFTAIVKDLETDDVELHWDSLVRLCRRCATAVVKEYGWSDFSVSTAVNEYLVSHTKKVKLVNESIEKRSRSSAARVDSLLFATSFAAALEQAQNDYEDVLNAYDQFRRLMKLFEDSTAVIEKSQQRKDAYIEKQQNELRQARHEIKDLKRQILDLKQQKQQAAVPPPQLKQQVRSNVSHISGISNNSKSEVSVDIPLNLSNPESGQKRQQQQSVAPIRSYLSGRGNVSSSTENKHDVQAPQPDNQSSGTKSSFRQQSTNIVSSPAPMARQRMQHNHIAEVQTANRSPQLDHMPKLLDFHHSVPHTVKSRHSERDAKISNHSVSRNHEQFSEQQGIHVPRPYDEPIVHLCMGSQRRHEPSPPAPPQQQQQMDLPQQHQIQSGSRRKHHHLHLNKANDEQHKYHPDLLEMSYSEPITTMDDEDDDDDYDSLFEIEMSFSSLGQDLISPSQVVMDVHQNKNEKRRELKTKNEMRSKSLLL